VDDGLLPDVQHRGDLGFELVEDLRSAIGADAESVAVQDGPLLEALALLLERLHVTAFRFRHANDVVTRIPVSMFGRDGYEHVGRLVYLTRGGEMSVEPAQIPGGLYRFFSDHSSTNYYERIRDLAADPANARLLRCER